MKVMIKNKMKQFFVFGILFGACALSFAQSEQTDFLTDVLNTTEVNSTHIFEYTYSNSTILQPIPIDNSSIQSANLNISSYPINASLSNNSLPNGFDVLFNWIGNVTQQNITLSPDLMQEFWNNLQNQQNSSTNPDDPFDKLWSNLLNSSAPPDDEEMQKLFPGGRVPWFNLFNRNSSYRKKINKFLQNTANLILFPFKPFW